MAQNTSTSTSKGKGRAATAKDTPEVKTDAEHLDAQQHKTIHERLAKVRSEVGSVGKGEVNQHFKYSFRGIDAVVNACAAPLRRNGVTVFPELRSIEYIETPTKQGVTLNTRVVVAYHFQCDEGEIVVVVPGEAQDAGDKGTAKAMSVAMRIALLQALNLPTDDPDPDHDSYERVQEPSDLEKKQAETSQVWAQLRQAQWNLGRANEDYRKYAGDGMSIDRAGVDELNGFIEWMRGQAEQQRAEAGHQAMQRATGQEPETDLPSKSEGQPAADEG